jgi:hypothetical protein
LQDKSLLRWSRSNSSELSSYAIGARSMLGASCRRIGDDIASTHHPLIFFLISRILSADYRFLTDLILSGNTCSCFRPHRSAKGTKNTTAKESPRQEVQDLRWLRYHPLHKNQYDVFQYALSCIRPSSNTYVLYGCFLYTIATSLGCIVFSDSQK